eukprot:TRINITY_DN15079_c0_g1_i1.p1 TRINITY_DN15079_c0_g1~~TRINITY_DN15079_c0_g1_i1.p1  ORF type:complete len:186 (-),score=16.58 TRINITY_DN15079_c0_g1_i1:80-637(-)
MRWNTWQAKRKSICESKANQDNQSPELRFTRNVVCLKIQGRGVGNLSMIDLPGLIQVTETKEDERYIGLVKGLVQHYIANDQTIIATVITCTDDIDNQGILYIAQKADPEGKRTVGILTKTEDGCHEKWLDTLAGKHHRLELGYFAVKNPSKTELLQKLRFEDYRQIEEKFLCSSPWSHCEPSVK